MSIKRTIEESQRLGDEAGSKLAEIEKRWAQLDHEIAAIQASAEAQMKQEEQLMLGENAADVHRILVAKLRARNRSSSPAGTQSAESICRKSSCFPRPTVNAIDEKTDQNLIGAFVTELKRGKEDSLMVSETTDREIA